MLSSGNKTGIMRSETILVVDDDPLTYSKVTNPVHGTVTVNSNGTFVYKAVATDLQGQSQTWEPFKRVTSQLQVVAGEIEIKKP